MSISLLPNQQSCKKLSSQSTQSKKTVVAFHIFLNERLEWFLISLIYKYFFYGKKRKSIKSSKTGLWDRNIQL